MLHVAQLKSLFFTRLGCKTYICCQGTRATICASWEQQTKLRWPSSWHEAHVPIWGCYFGRLFYFRIEKCLQSISDLQCPLHIHGRFTPIFTQYSCVLKLICHHSSASFVCTRHWVTDVKLCKHLLNCVNIMSVQTGEMEICRTKQIRIGEFFFPVLQVNIDCITYLELPISKWPLSIFRAKRRQAAPRHERFCPASSCTTVLLHGKYRKIYLKSKFTYWAVLPLRCGPHSPSRANAQNFNSPRGNSTCPEQFNI